MRSSVINVGYAIFVLLKYANKVYHKGTKEKGKGQV